MYSTKPYVSVNKLNYYCGHCKNLNLTTYNTHFIRESPNKNSPITCPELLKTKCRFCFVSGHTVSHCPAITNNTSQNYSKIQVPVVTTQTQYNNVFSEFSDSDSDDDNDSITTAINDKPKNIIVPILSESKKTYLSSLLSSPPPPPPTEKKPFITSSIILINGHGHKSKKRIIPDSLMPDSLEESGLFRPTTPDFPPPDNYIIKPLNVPFESSVN